MQTNRQEAMEAPIELREVRPDLEDRLLASPQGSSNRWWVYVVAGLTLIIVTGAFISISQMKTVVSAKATLETENKALKEQLASAKPATPAITPTVKIEETPKAKVIKPENLRIVVAATYGFVTPLDDIRTEVSKAMIGCLGDGQQLSLCIKSVAMNGGHSWVATIDKAGGMEEIEATNVATCLQPLLPPDAKPIVKKPSLYRSPKCY